MTIEKVTTYAEYRSKIVEPDYRDFVDNESDLRMAFHSAISLFHLHDWVYGAQAAYINANFVFQNNGVATPVTGGPQFANALADLCPEFELIRGVANSAKHLTLRGRNAKRPPPPSNMPSHAANTFSDPGGWPDTPWPDDEWQDEVPAVKLEGDNGQHLVLIDVATTVHTMWTVQFAKHGW